MRFRTLKDLVVHLREFNTTPPLEGIQYLPLQGRRETYALVELIVCGRRCAAFQQVRPCEIDLRSKGLHKLRCGHWVRFRVRG